MNQPNGTVAALNLAASSDADQIAKCLADFGAKANGDFSKLAEFIGVQPRVVETWLQKKHMPVGSSRQKLLVILDTIGYRCPAVTDINELGQLLMKQVAFGIHTIESVQTNLNVSRDHVIRMVSGYRQPVGEIAEYLKIMLDDKQDDLIKAENSELVLELKRIAKLPLGRPSPYKVPSLALAPEPESKFTADDREEYLIEVFANLAMALVPIAERLASPAFTADDRELLRTKVGRYKMFDLKNALIKLSGERARNSLNQELHDLGYGGK